MTGECTRLTRTSLQLEYLQVKHTLYPLEGVHEGHAVPIHIMK